MHLYNLTLQKPGAINTAVFGSFSGVKRNEFMLARGHVLDLVRPDPETGKLHSVATTEAFGIIRSLLRFRLHGQEFDHLIVGSDSGKVSVLRFDAEAAAFRTVQCETFGKTGCRRITPGQYLAGDPRGRAIMLGAIEKQKLVYLLNRDDDKLTISSPLEAHKSNIITFDLTCLDCGFDNPVFAALELDYTDSDADPTGEAAAAASKVLAHYELDLGLNTVTRKWARETDRSANAILSVPGGGSGVSDGPGGALVLAENWVLYESPTQPTLRTPIPRRADLPAERGVLITACTVHRQKAGQFFFLLQSEYGDLYKVTLEYEAASNVVSDVIVQYFDTIPPATSLCISRNGFLFTASEFGAHYLYQFLSLGEGDETALSRAFKADVTTGDTVEIECAIFEPRALTNLAKVDELPSLAPITDMQVVVPPAIASVVGDTAAAGYALAAAAVAGSGSLTPFLATLCGRGPRSTLRVLREGLSVTDMAVSGMPGSPIAVFTVPMSLVPATLEDGTQATTIPIRYVVISFINATLCLTVGEGLEETPSKETGILDTVPTLAMQLLANDSLLQVHPGGMRLIVGTGAAKKVQQWQAPGKRSIEKVAANARQVVVALSGGDVIYFELDEHGKLDEKQQVSFGAEITAIAIDSVPEGRLRAPFCAVSDSSNMVRILSLDPSHRLTQVSAQALKTDATSLAFVTMRMGATDPSPRLFIGLRNGVLVRVSVDPTSGVLQDPRSRFVGSRPVKVAAVSLGGNPACLALSSRAWINYNYQSKFYVSPLSYESLEDAAPFISEAIPDGVIGVSGNTLRIFTIDRLGDMFNHKVLPLRYTPREMAVIPKSTLAVVIESDHNCYSVADRLALAAGTIETAAPEPAAPAADVADMEMEMEMDMDEEPSAPPQTNGHAGAAQLPDFAVSSVATPGENADLADPQAEGVDLRRVGLPVPPEAGKWACSIRLVDLSTIAAAEETVLASTHHHATHHIIDLSDDEAALSVAVVPFHDHEAETFVLVGTVKGMSFHPRRHAGGFIRLYRLVDWDAHVNEAGREVPADDATAVGTRRVKRLQLVHVTPVEDLPYAIAAFNGRALVGVGKVLRLYDLGRKKLLRKAECKGFPTLVHSIQCAYDRIFVADAAESIYVVKYKRAENALAIIADDIATRHTTCFTPLDTDTVAVGDKFGNVAIIRLPDDMNEDAEYGASGKLVWDTAVFHGAPNKFETLAHFYVGEAITAMHKAALAGGSECILYSTVSGSIGALLPFASKEELDFFTHLEIYLRNEGLSLIGRDHLSYRSFYVPVKAIIDGDLCEMYSTLAPIRQAALATDLERSVSDVNKKLEDVRNKIV